MVTGGIAVGGDMFCDNVFTLSDGRLKDDVRALPNALECICNLQGCTFTWRDAMPPRLANRRAVGVIAQDVHRHAPLASVQDPRSGLYGVDYMRLVPYLIESVKTLKRRCDELDREIKRMRCHSL